MIASQPFAAAPRLRRFLRYVVDRVLAGEGGELKEYTIGVDVFERSPDYDPRIDSIVRVEAGRLRAKVDEYYNGEGARDRVIVRIPRGSYVPLFELKEAVAAPAAAAAPVVAPGPTVPVAGSPAGFRIRWQVAVLLLAIIAVPGLVLWPAGRTPPTPPPAFRVAVLPFTHYSAGGADEMLAARITDGVTTELARLNKVGVVSRTSAGQFRDARKPLREIAQHLTASAVVEGTVIADGDVLRVNTRIVDSRTDLKSSVRDFEGRRDRLDELSRRIAETLSASFQAHRVR